MMVSQLVCHDGLLVLLSLSRRSGFIPQQIQDVLLAVASLACGGLHILLRLLLLRLCNEYASLPKKRKKNAQPAGVPSAGMYSRFWVASHP